MNQNVVSKCTKQYTKCKAHLRYEIFTYFSPKLVAVAVSCLLVSAACKPANHTYNVWNRASKRRFAKISLSCKAPSTAFTFKTLYKTEFVPNVSK